jgi:hypothetical protein
MHPVFHFLAALRGFRIAFVAVWRDPETKALPVVVGILLVSGTMFYWSVEDWASSRGWSARRGRGSPGRKGP